MKVNRRKLNVRSKPPLPFQGNKSIWKPFFQQVISEIPNGNDRTFVDLFGGSFYLSYLIHKQFPGARIICNDYDNYKERLEHIPETNELLRLIKEVVTAKKQKLISKENKQQINDIIINYEGYKDVITLSSNLIFSSLMFTELEPFLNHEFYNVLNKSDYDTNYSDYIEGIEFVCCDWKELYNEFKNNDYIIYIADPPYLYTDKSGYSSPYWNLKNALEVLEILKEKNFIVYASEKPGIITIINYLKSQGVDYQDFKSVQYDRGCCTRMNKGKPNGECILYHFEKIDLDEDDVYLAEE